MTLRTKDLLNPWKLREGKRSLPALLREQGRAKASWKQDSSVLRQEVRKGRPTRDVSPDDYWAASVERREQPQRWGDYSVFPELNHRARLITVTAAETPAELSKLR